MPGDAAAVKRHAKVAQRQVQRMAAEVMDKKRVAGDAQAFAGEADDLLRLQMMQKKRAANGVKTVVAEGKSQGIAADAGMESAEVRWRAIQDDRPQSRFPTGPASAASAWQHNLRHRQRPPMKDLSIRAAVRRGAAGWPWCGRRQTSD